MHIIEKSNMDLTNTVKENDSVFLRNGRSNTIIVDKKVYLHDVRAIHTIGNGYEFISYNKEDGSDRHSTTIFDVESIKVQSIYWSKKLFFDE